MLGKVLKSLIAPQSRGAVLARAEFDAGTAARKAGNLTDAAAHFERAGALDPKNVDYHLSAGVAYYALGDKEQARRCCETAIAADERASKPRNLLSQLNLPGPYYSDVLSLIHAHLRPRTYIEIGVFEGESIRLAHPETRAIGIDPEPKIRYPLTAQTTIYAETSNDFFSRRDVREELGGLPLDLAFIDGMHRFEVALRDFINTERYCAPQSTVLVHDCYPFDRFTAERERHTVFWSGDIWRLVLILKKHRPDLRVHTIGTAPTGLGLIRGLNPQSRVLEEKYDEIVREYSVLDYSVLDADKAGSLSLFPNDWEKIKELLA
jgi:hypothetical protein